MNIDFLHAVFCYNLLGLPIWCFIRYIIFKINKQKKDEINIKYETFLYLFFAYLVSIVAITLMPLPFTKGNGFVYINLKPIVTQIAIISMALNNHLDIWFIYENIFGNILLFVPFGFFIPMLFPSRFVFLKVFCIGLIGSFFIEATQWIESYWHIYRMVDIDDVILNTLGSCIGFIFFKILKTKFNITKFSSVF